MELTRRDFLKLSGSGLGAAALVNLGFSVPALATTEPLRITRAKESTTICPYCAVGCGILVMSANNKVVNTEGNPDHPINQGTLCSKGTALIQISSVDGKVNPDRITEPMYRASGAKKWTEISWDEAFDKIARKIKDTRDANWIEKDDVDGKKVTCNRVEAIASFGGASLDNEECYLLVKMLRALGLVYVEHQARI
jgi:formate dehydrogenase major subunit